jgi:hypothetical protein
MTVDLERSVTFSDYRPMDEELGMMDEETINWPVLCTRIFAFFLLLLIIVCFALEEITPRFLILAAIIGALLVLVIFSTYFDIRRYLCCCIFKSNVPPGLSSNISVDSPTNPVLLATSKNTRANAKSTMASQLL